MYSKFGRPKKMHTGGKIRIRKGGPNKGAVVDPQTKGTLTQTGDKGTGWSSHPRQHDVKQKRQSFPPQQSRKGKKAKGPSENKIEVPKSQRAPCSERRKEKGGKELSITNNKGVGRGEKKEKREGGVIRGRGGRMGKNLLPPEESPEKKKGRGTNMEGRECWGSEDWQRGGGAVRGREGCKIP